MSRDSFAAGGDISLTGSNVTYVVIAAVIALVALGFAAALTKAVLAAGRGTNKMQEIAAAVQEGASAYLVRQFKTLGIFVVIAVVLLFLLPVSDAGDNETAVKIGRSLFFVVGAVFSALIGGLGGFGGQIPAPALMGPNVTVSGIYVGSRENFEAMNAFIAQHKIKPVIDKVIEFKNADAAYKLMESGDFLGKIVIRM